MRRTAFAALLLLLPACRYKLPGPPLVIEMPEIGAKIDVSGWMPSSDRELVPGTGKNAKKLKGTTSTFGDGVSFRANPSDFPGLDVYRLSASDAKDCLAPFTERGPMVEALDFVEPLTGTTIAGADAATLVTDQTLPGFENSPLRTRYLAIAKGGTCYRIMVHSQKPLWDQQSYLWEPAFRSVKPL